MMMPGRKMIIRCNKGQQNAALHNVTLFVNFTVKFLTIVIQLEYQ